MGLDMYLSRELYVGAQYEHRKVKADIDVVIGAGTENEKELKVDPSKVESITEKVAYWRKENHIHRWFVDNCQDGIDECQRTSINVSKLKELVDICNEILTLADSVLPKAWRDCESKNFFDFEKQVVKKGWEIPKELGEKAEELLPTASGFFFGSTAYNLWYFRGLIDTVNQLQPCIDKDIHAKGFDAPEYFYQSSW